MQSTKGTNYIRLHLDKTRDEMHLHVHTWLLIDACAARREEMNFMAQNGLSKCQTNRNESMKQTALNKQI